jgi:hypothetical protein
LVIQGVPVTMVSHLAVALRQSQQNTVKHEFVAAVIPIDIAIVINSPSIPLVSLIVTVIQGDRDRLEVTIKGSEQYHCL